MSTFLFILLVYILGHIPFIKIMNGYSEKKYDAWRTMAPINKKKPKKSEIALLKKISMEAERNEKMWGLFGFLYFVFGIVFVFNVMDGKISNITLFNYW